MSALEVAIQAVWAIGLVIALLLTIVVLKEVSLVLGTLRGIHRLVQRTQLAASGLAANLEAVEQLDALAKPAEHLHQAVREMAAGCRSIRHQLEGSGK